MALFLKLQHNFDSLKRCDFYLHSIQFFKDSLISREDFEIFVTEFKTNSSKLFLAISLT